MNLGCFTLERGAWPFRGVEELEERTFLTCAGEEGRGPQEPIPGWQAVGGGFGLGLGCVDPSGASWRSQECWDPWAAPQDKVQSREGAGQNSPGFGTELGALPEPEQSSDVEQILQGLIQTSPTPSHPHPMV